MSAEVHHLMANGEDAAPIAISILDADGNIVTNADQKIEFEVSCPGSIASVANGNPASHESNFVKQRMTFRGLCMVIIKTADRLGHIAVEAHAAGLKPARITIHVDSVPIAPVAGTLRKWPLKL
jgi:beta-galactosidase